LGFRLSSEVMKYLEIIADSLSAVKVAIAAEAKE